MKTRYLIIYILIFITLGAFICYKIASGDGSGELIAETTEINRLIVSVQENWDEISSKNNVQIEKTGTVDYAVLDSESNVLEFTRDDMSKTISAATTHYDIIRDIEVDGNIVGKLIVHNPSNEMQKARNHKYAELVALMLSVALIMITIYSLYINQGVIRPFSRLKGFAARIASGDLESPLEMDRGHVFGEFTEAFDIMREELKASREREEAAVRSRKELVAELSHDIKTPVASIKAMSDVMSLTAKDDMERDTIAAINGKADQIDKLISNLFHATLEELEQLEVNVEELASTEILHMIQEADYMKKVTDSDIKEVVILGDKLRLNQVISNIISNSYKYAGTEISIKSYIEKGLEAERNSRVGAGFLVIDISDKGGGVPEEELEMITEKFKRGSNSEGKDGSGLGLYISKYMMEKMGGGLVCHNNGEGFTISIRICIA